MQKTILLLPGDGIGTEIILQAERVLSEVVKKTGYGIEVQQAQIGGASYDAHGTPLTDETLAMAQSADAILLGAVGGPQYDRIERELRPERALLKLRSELDLFANLRPAILYPELVDSSSLKPEKVGNLDLLIVRELTGGIYFGQPRGIEKLPDGERRGFNTYVYTESEIERIAHSAFQAAQKRNQKLCSIDKANVLEVTELWREVVTRVGAAYPDVALSHMYVDNAVMQMIREPKQFDVILSGNMFGDILSDAAAMLTGSIGMLPSASLDADNKGMYEPVHGSAPDIAGQDKANPIATILSLAMMFRHSFDDESIATHIEQACKVVLAKKLRTADIFTGEEKLVGCVAMGDAILQELTKNY